MFLTTELETVHRSITFHLVYSLNEHQDVAGGYSNINKVQELNFRRMEEVAYLVYSYKIMDVSLRVDTVAVKMEKGSLLVVAL